LLPLFTADRDIGGGEAEFSSIVFMVAATFSTAFARLSRLSLLGGVLSSLGFLVTKYFMSGCQEVKFHEIEIQLFDEIEFVQ
jgi:hypothetical protein